MDVIADSSLRSDRRGVTPVIGIILMVAVAVILAAIIGAFVLDVGSDPQPVPNTRFAFDYNSSGNLTISHDGGETIDSKNTLELEVVYTDASGSRTEPWGLPVDSESSITLPTKPKSDTEVRVIWTGPDGESSDVIARDTVP